MAVTMILLTLILSIGPVVVGYAMLDALLLRPWPLPDAHEVVVSSRGVSAAEFRFLRDRSQSVRLGAVAQSCPVVRDAELRVVSCELVSGNYFDLLQLPLTLGRGFEPRDDIAGAPVRIVVIGFGVWRRQFASSPDAIGRTVTLNGKTFTIVGVAPERTVRRFAGLPPQYWLPLATYGELTDYAGGDFLFDRTVCCVDLLGRLKGRAEATSDELTALHHVFRPDLGPSDVLRVRDTRPMSGPWARSGSVLVSFLMLSGLLVVAACCANVSTIQVARGIARTEEFAVMRALGATRWSLAQPLILENVCMMLVALMAVAAFCVFGLRVVEAQLTTTFGESGFDLRPNLRVGLVCLGVTSVAVFATGVLPVLRGTRNRTARSSTRGTFRWIVGIQVACSTVTVLIAAMLWQGLMRASANAGFEVDGVARVLLSTGANPDRATLVRKQLTSTLLSASSDPAAVAETGPPQLLFGVAVEGGPLIESVDVVPGTAGWLRLLGVPLIEGRFLDETDMPSAVVVNETLARRAWPGSVATGASLQADGVKQVVGVVRDFQLHGATRLVRPTIYVTRVGGGILMARNDAPTRTRVERSAAVLDASSQISFEPLSAALDRALEPARSAVAYALAVAGVSVGIASSGLFAVVSLAGQLRRREIAVRIALGATFRSILLLLLKGVLTALLMGLFVGLVIGSLASPVLRTLVATVSSTDGAAWGYAILAIATATILVALLPVKRALQMSLAEELKSY